MSASLVGSEMCIRDRTTRVLVDDMAGITARMDTNQEIVGELQKQMDVFANL